MRNARQRIRKFELETRSLDELKSGDLICVSYGILTLVKVEVKPGDRRCMHLKNAIGESVTETTSIGNWPEVVTGFTREYAARHPQERLGN